MVQKNKATGNTRKIRRVTGTASTGAWEWEDDRGWAQYSPEDDIQITKAIASGEPSVQFSVGSNVNVIDLNAKFQRNMKTGNVRRIRQLNNPTISAPPEPPVVLNIFGFLSDVKEARKETEQYFNQNWTDKSISIPNLVEFPNLREDLETLNAEFGVDLNFGSTTLELCGHIDAVSKAHERAFDLICAEKSKDSFSVPLHWGVHPDVRIVSLAQIDEEFRYIMHKS
jgi:hypothetical protein